jgi:hypothetical protein
MKTSAPRFITWFVATAVGAVAILMYLDVIHLGNLNQYSFWILAGGFALLSLATLTRNL